MIQINPLKSYIDGGVRAALTTPPSASLVFDLPGKAIWVKGVKLKGTDHTYTFSHDNYITLTNTPDSNESEDIKIGVNTSALKSAIDTTYGVVSTTANGLAPKFTSGNKLAASAATTYYFLGWTGTTLKWYQAPFRNIRINSETTDRLGVNSTDPLIISSGNGISVTWDSTNKKIIITNTKPDINHNTDRTGIKLATVSGTKKTDSTLILANSTSGLNIQGGTNKFLIGDGTNYIEVPVVPSIFNKDATIGTALTTIATIAGVDIKAKIASYSLSNHTHSVKINGSTKTIAASGAVDLGNYLPLSGGTMTGSIYIPGLSATIIHTTRSESNWIYISELLTGSSKSETNYQASIGWHNTGGNSNGALTLVPYAQNSEPWLGNVGLYIAQNSLKFNGTAISLAGHTHAWNSLTHSSTTENQAILTNGSANGWKLYTLNISGWNNAANNAHSHSNKSVLDGITSTLVSNWNTAYNFVNTISGTDTDKVINKWDEIVNFLAGISEDNKLNTLLNNKLSVYKLADNTNIGTIKNNGIYYSTSDSSSGTLVNSPFSNSFTLINMTSYDGEDDLRRSRLAFNAYGEIKISNDRGLANTAETWYNILTSKNTYISENKGYINGTQITYVNNSGNATNATNARKLVNWYSTRPTSLNTQFGDGSLRIFHATASTTEGKSPSDATVLHLAWDNNGGWDTQLGISPPSGRVYSRGQNKGTWQSWKTLAFTTDIPTSLKNPHALTISLNGTSQGPYDGSAAKSINITPSSIDAATSGHNHDSSYVKYAKITKSTADSANAKPYIYNIENEVIISGYYNYWYILNLGQYSGGNFGTQIAMPYQQSLTDSELFIRSAKGGSWRTWRRVLHSNNYASILDSRYYTESEINNLLSNKLNTSNFNWTNLPGKLVAGNEFNIVNAGFKEGMWFNYLPINDRSKTATITGYHFGNGATGYASIKASGFIKNGSSSSYILLGDGGHKAISDFATSGHNHNNSYVASVSISGNNLRINKNGVNTDLIIPYATNADKVDGYHADSFTKKHTEYNFNSNGTAPYNYVWLCRIGNKNGYSGLALTLDVNSRYHKHYQINMLISTGQYAYSSSSISINKSDSAPNVYYVRTANGSDIGYDYFDIYVTCSAWNSGGYKIINTNVNGNLSFTNKCTLVDGVPSEAVAVGLMYSSVNYANSAGSALTATTASKLGTSTVGATNVPIYLNGGTPTVVNLNSTANNLINNLSVGDSIPADNDYYIAQYVNGGTTNTTYHRRPHSALYAYIKGKAEGIWNISINGNAKGLSKSDVLDSQEKIDNFLTANILKYATFKTTESNNVGFNANDGMILSIPWSDVKYGAQIAFDDVTSGTVKVRGKNNSWGNWYTLLHSGNSNVSGGGNTWGSSITVNINGTSKTLTIPGNPNTDYRVTQSETTTANYRPLVLGYTSVSTAGSGMTGSVTNQVYLSNKFYVQPSTGNLYATTFVGALSGNAATATKLQTSRNLWGNSFNGTANISGTIIFNNVTSGLCEGILWTCGDNDFARIKAGATGSDAGYLEIATADGGSEPIYVRQYSDVFSTIVRTLTLLDGSGNTILPGSATATGFNKIGSSNSYVLLGGGGHKAESSLSVANADKVDGYHASYGSNTPYGTIPVITTSGWMDVGKLFEFHFDNTTGSDYSTILRCKGNYSNVVDLPSSNGTLALTSQIPTVTNYYWANIKISNTSNSNTAPTFGSAIVNTRLSITSSTLTKTNPTNLQLVINGPSLDSSVTPELKDWPGIGFHMPNRTWGSLIFNGNITAINSNYNGYINYYGAGFRKNGSSDSYVLLGGGGHKAISDFMLKTDELSNNLTTINKSLIITQAWMDTGIKYTDLPANGTYIIQVSANNTADSIYSNYWSGIISWYIGGTNDSDSDEIILHRAGHAYHHTIYLRTIMTTSSDGRHLRLQIAADTNLSTAVTYTFKFKRVI